MFQSPGSLRSWLDMIQATRPHDLRDSEILGRYGQLCKLNQPQRRVNLATRRVGGQRYLLIGVLAVLWRIQQTELLLFCPFTGEPGCSLGSPVKPPGICVLQPSAVSSAERYGLFFWTLAIRICNFRLSRVLANLSFT